jgi:hypothetical protein
MRVIVWPQMLIQPRAESASADLMLHDLAIHQAAGA